MNKKEISRYTLGIIDKVETRTFSSQYEIGELLDKIQKYNGNPKNPYFLGKARILGNNIIEFKRYKKITEPSTLEKIDMMTTMYDNESLLKKSYGINNNHNIVILYRYNKDIRDLPVVYKKDKNYIDRRFLIHSVNNFFEVTPSLLSTILDSEQIEASCRTNIEEYDRLFALRETLKYNPNADITAFSRFYSSFITQGGKFNYFNFRLIAMAFMEENRKLELSNKEQETPEQLIMKEYKRLELKEDYEETKLKLTNN